MDRFGLAHRISRRQDRLLDRLRDRGTDAAAGLRGTGDSFAALIGEEFALLVTFRRSGEPVPTPVWFGMHDDRLYVGSLADAGKVKRLGHDRRVRVVLGSATYSTGSPRAISPAPANDRGFIMRRGAASLSSCLPPGGSTCRTTATVDGLNDGRPGGLVREAARTHRRRSRS